MNKQDNRDKAKWLLDYASEEYLDSIITMLKAHKERLAKCN